MNDVLEYLLDFFIQRGVDINEDNYEKFNFMEDGEIDSFAVLTLLIAIEDEFDVKITPIDMLDDNNKTIDGLLQLIISRKNGSN